MKREEMSIKNTIIGLFICLCALIVIFASAQVGAVVNPTADTITLDVQCANGKWGRGKCPSGHEYTGTVPVLLYSDITSGVDNGWSAAEPNKGAVVTVWGRNLGNIRGSSYVTVGGVNLTTAGDYAETWAEEKPIPGIQKVTFWLKSEMPEGATSITVTVGGVTSNSLPFSVRNTGNLYFVDNTLGTNGNGSYESPFNTPGTALATMTAGDTIYFKTGTYNQMYWGGGENIWVRDTAPDGTAAAPITFTAYPNSTPLFDSRTANNSSFHTGMRFDSPWYTVSKLKFNSYASGVIGSAEGIRVVGNDVDGGNVFRFGIGVITGARDDNKILGNAVHGGETGDPLDHAIYLSGCAPNVGNEVAYNWIYDNNFGYGPMIVVNHQDARCASNVRLASHYIHSNFIDCTNYPSRAIGLYHQSWDAGTDTAGEPEPTYVYNNITYNCGNVDQPVAYQNSAHGRWYNNTFYNSLSESISSLSVSGTRVVSAEIKNNIFHKTSPNGAYYSEGAPSFTSSNNLYFGAGNGPVSDANAVNADPLITVDAANATVTIASNSPANNAGDDTTLTTVIKDFFGNIRQSIIDIGASLVGVSQ